MVQAMEVVNSGKITTMTSIELANISGRRHDVLIKSIERMNEDLIQMNRPPAVEDIYMSKNNIKSRQYILSIYHCELLAMALDGIARIKVLDKIDELRKIVNKPRTYQEIMSEALQLAAQKVEELEEKILLDRPKVSFATAVEWSTSSVKVEDWIKSIQPTLKDSMGRNKAFKWLRDEGFLMETNFNKPYQHWVDQKLFEVKQGLIMTPNGSKSVFTTLVTGKWQLYLLDRMRTMGLTL